MWGHFWSSWGSFGDIFDRLEGRLGSFWVVLGRLGALLGHFWSSWGVFGGLLAVLGRSWGVLTRQEGCDITLGPLLIDFWTHLGCQKGTQNGAQDDQKSIKNRLKKRSRFRTILRRSWGDLGPILVPSWEPRRVKIVLSPKAGLIF